MKKFEIKNQIITSENIFGSHKFKIVKKIPSNYFVWNIGENMESDIYIPICQDLHPGNKDDYQINTETLKAIKLTAEEVKALRSAASVGINSIQTAQKALRSAASVGINSIQTAQKALKSKRCGYLSDRKREQAQKTIKIFEKISD
jgi:hypothetical protein